MKKYIPVLLLCLIALAIGIFNFVPGAFLTGGDNLHPEFNFGLNIKRSLFAVWQEYQGTGLLGGMGHASDLVRQFFLLGLSSVFPLNTLRFIWTMVGIGIGSLGAYFLTKKVIQTTSPDSPHLLPLSFLGGLFYVLNLSTVQTFYAPFEVFTAHFAALPWLLLTTIQFAQNQTKKNLLLFALVLLLATPQAYVPTLFLVYLIATLILFPFLFLPSLNRSGALIAMKKGVVLFGTIIVLNLFWLLPFGYFTLTDASTNVSAKINQMATETIFLQNKEFGGISDVMLLKGFWFNNVDPIPTGGSQYMITPWRDHLQSPFIQGIGYVLFAVILVGLVFSIKKRHPLLLGLSTLLFFGFAMLATATPPFSWIDSVFRSIPLFSQAFRFPFTKFSILTSLMYSIFFVLGVEAIIRYLKIKSLRIICFAFCIALLVTFAFPIFTGHLFYVQERINMPKEYSSVFDFFKKQDPTTRIAIFPQPNFWGWYFYRWGYIGSGFLWYGIEQPILDRAFDVWSTTSENYYWEMSYALSTKNETLFANVLSKYQVQWLLVDKNVLNPSSPKALFFDELESMVAKLPAIKKSATFDKITIYRVTPADKVKRFVFFSDNLPTANGYTWGNNDQSYTDLGNYTASLSGKQDTQFIYPFRSLFSGKMQTDNAFSTKENVASISFSQFIPASSKATFLSIPSLLSKEKIIPATIVTKHDATGALTISLAIKTPEIFLNENRIWGETTMQPLFVASNTPAKTSFPLSLNVNGITTIPIKDEQKDSLMTTFLTLDQANIFTLRDSKANEEQTYVLPSDKLQALSMLTEQTITLPPHETSTLRIDVPKINDAYLDFVANASDHKAISQCDDYRRGLFSVTKETDDNEQFTKLYAKNTTVCLSLYTQNLSHETGYVIFTTSKNDIGRGLHFWVLNEDEKLAPIDTYLPSDKKSNLSSFIIPPQEQFGKAYSFHFDNISIGDGVTQNSVGKTAVYPIPYSFLSSLVIADDTQQKTTYDSRAFSVSHPNESLYTVSLNEPFSTTNSTIVLSQSYNPGWKAYAFDHTSIFTTLFPFIGGKEITDHVKVNNWENGWTLPSNSTSSSLSLRADGLNPTPSTLVIVFLPQYLEYLGFLLLIPALISIVFVVKRKHAEAKIQQENDPQLSS